MTTPGMFAGLRYDLMNEWPAHVVIFIYVIASVSFLPNLLIAQLRCEHQASYTDLVG